MIDYSHSTHIEGMPSATIVKANLVASQVASIYEMDYLNISNFIDEEDGENGPILNVRANKNPRIFKDFTTQSIYSVERVFMNPFLVKDTFTIFNWSLTNVFETILGYKCQKVNLNYRGRDYEAFFTTEIPFNAGPWKFSGLPGCILKVKSTDGVFEIFAEKIQIKNAVVSFEKPFVKELDKSISWDDFIKKYKKKYEELQSYTGPDGGSMSIPKRKIEVLIED
ncbi:MAG: GLPGLI family protein [Psychroserpens sp.]|jgi:GLPGLI family protein